MHALIPLIILSALAAPPQVTAAPPQFDVQLLDGSKVSGTLTRWDEAQLVVETSSGSRELYAAKVASVAPHAPPAKPAVKPVVWIDLIDGSRVAASDYSSAQGRAKIALSADESLDIPTADVSAVRMQPESEASAQEWSRLRGKKPQGDLLVTGNQTGIDYHQGAIEDVTDQKIGFVLEGKTLNVKRPKVYGLIYYHAESTPAAEAPYTIVDAAGSRWISSTLKLEAGDIEFTGPAGRAMSRPLAQIAQIDLSCGKIVYLSDLKPDSEKVAPSPFTITLKELPSRAQFSRVRRDENMESKSLRLFGQVFRKGMAMQSRSELAWTLPSQFARLQAIAGIDDDIIRPLGNVRLRILGDGKTLFDEPISGADKAAKPISVDMTGVRRLVVVVESQGNFGAGDHLVLGNLRLIK